MTTEVLGKPIKRVEDRRLITGKGRYVDDINLAGTAHMAILRSPYAHANIKTVDTSIARSKPGVVDVITGADVPYNPLPMAWPAGGSAGIASSPATTSVSAANRGALSPLPRVSARISDAWRSSCAQHVFLESSSSSWSP